MLGQVFFRKTGTIINGKEAVIIAGVVSLSEEEKQKIKGEHQYIITGCDLYPLWEKDISQETKGMNIDGVLLTPIWRL